MDKRIINYCMDQIYIAPRPTLTEDDVELLESITDALRPVSAICHHIFSRATTNCKPFVYLIGVHLEMDNALTLLDNYHRLIFEMMEDFEEISNYSLQLSETIRACESIQEQITRSAAAVFEIDNKMFDDPKYSASFIEKSRMLHAQYQANDASDVQQLELNFEPAIDN